MGRSDPRVGPAPSQLFLALASLWSEPESIFHIQIPTSPASYPAVYGISPDWSFISVSVSGKVFTGEQKWAVIQGLSPFTCLPIPPMHPSHLPNILSFITADFNLVTELEVTCCCGLMFLSLVSQAEPLSHAQPQSPVPIYVWPPWQSLHNDRMANWNSK